MTKLVCALLVDLDDAADFPGSGGSVLGRPLAAYPLMAARASAHVRRIYAVTGSPPVKAAALQYDAVIIDPPAGKPSLDGHLLHGCRQAAADLCREDAAVELLVALFPNAPAVTKDMIDSGVEALLDRPELDSALSVAPLARWTPGLTMRQNAGGLLEPFLPAGKDAAGAGRKDVRPAGAGGTSDTAGATPSPQAQPVLNSPEGAAAWYPTWGVTVLRPGSLEQAAGGGAWPWLGRQVMPIKTWGPGLIDFHWQLPGLEYWLKKNGAPDLSSNLERRPLPKPQLSPKGGRR
jgi:hypothetical protein